MINKIIVSKHAIEEYLNDNPKEKNPEIKLKYIFTNMLSKSKTKKAKFYVYQDRPASIIKYRVECIVYDNYNIITYYRIVNKKITKYKDNVLWLINNVLNWEREKQIDMQLQKHKIQKKLKENRKILRKMNKAQRYNVLAKCFNTR